MDHGILVGGIEVGLVPAGVGHPGAGIVRDYYFRNRAKKFKGMDMGADPGRELPGEDRFRIAVVARPQSGDEEIGRGDRSGRRIMEGDRITGVVDEEFFSCFVILAKRDVEHTSPVPVAQTELAVLVAFGILLLVLMPEKLESDMLSFQFRVDIIEGRHVPLLRGQKNGGREKQVLQRGLVELLGKGPGETRPLRPVQIFPDGGSADTAAHCRLPRRQTVVPTKTQDLLYLSHR